MVLAGADPSVPPLGAQQNPQDGDSHTYSVAAGAALALGDRREEAAGGISSNAMRGV